MKFGAGTADSAAITSSSRSMSDTRRSVGSNTSPYWKRIPASSVRRMRSICGSRTFWFQPLYRWIAGLLHLVFGDSSVGERFWDGACLLAGAGSLPEIGAEVRELAERARARKLKPEEYTGATFSISNLGMFGIDEFTAVINPPEGAILAIGAMAPKPVVRDGQIVVRQTMRVTMSCDHRVVDGATGAQFLQTFKQVMENPLYLFLAH